MSNTVRVAGSHDVRQKLPEEHDLPVVVGEVESRLPKSPELRLRRINRAQSLEEQLSAKTLAEIPLALAAPKQAERTPITEVGPVEVDWRRGVVASRPTLKKE